MIAEARDMDGTEEIRRWRFDRLRVKLAAAKRLENDREPSPESMAAARAAAGHLFGSQHTGTLEGMALAAEIGRAPDARTSSGTRVLERSTTRTALSRPDGDYNNRSAAFAPTAVALPAPTRTETTTGGSSQDGASGLHVLCPECW